jgi:hypothetical protein
LKKDRISQLPSIFKQGDPYNTLFNKDIPAGIITGYSTVDKIDGTFSVNSDQDFVLSTINGKEVQGYFTAHLASKLFYDADLQDLNNFALIERENHYDVSRIDFDDSFSYLYNIERNPLIKKSGLQKQTPQYIISQMFSKHAGHKISFSPTDIIEGLATSYQVGNLNPKKEFSDLAISIIKSMSSLQSIPLEDSFVSALRTDIDTINNVISEKFKEIEDRIPSELVSKIYNINAIKKASKDPFKWQSQSEDEWRIISNQDLREDPSVKKYCASHKEQPSSTIEQLSQIVQCVTSVSYSQLLGIGLCYTSLNHKYNPEKIDTLRILESLPSPETKYTCKFSATLNSSPCSHLTQNEEFECRMHIEDVNICETLGDHLDVCTNYHGEL